MADGFEHALREARTRLESGDHAGALAISDRLVASHPGRAFTWVQRARILLGLDAYREAIESLVKGLELNPGVPEVSVHLARLLSNFHMHREVDALHDAMDERHRGHVPLLLAFAEIYTYRNRLDLALACTEAALTIAGLRVPALFMRGRIHVFRGDFPAAISDFDQCLDMDPSASGPHWYLSRIQGSQDRSAQLKRILSAGGLNSKDRAAMWFALHHYQHRNEERDRCRSLAEACRLQRSLVNYSEKDADALFRSLKNMRVQRCTGGVADQVATPVFIVGMHRSGTTLLEYSLARSASIFPCGELYDFPACLRMLSNHNAESPVDPVVVSRAPGMDMCALGARYLRSTGYLSGGAKYFTDKLPSNYVNIGFIAEALPQAKIIHISRAPADTCFSNLRELFSDQTNPFSYDPAEMARHYLRYADLMAHWNERYGDRILNVRYEDLVDQTEKTLQHVREYCGLAAAEVDRMAAPAVSTASAFKVRGEIANRSLLDWKGYEEFMAPALSILEGRVVPSS
jgi:tetratricopeptide (TPR) repeat protein